MPKSLFRGVRLIDPVSGHDGTTDVLIEDESIAAVGAGIEAKGTTVVECGGL